MYPKDYQNKTKKSNEGLEWLYLQKIKVDITKNNGKGMTDFFYWKIVNTQQRRKDSFKGTKLSPIYHMTHMLMGEIFVAYYKNKD